MKSTKKFKITVNCPGNHNLYPMEIVIVPHPNGNDFVLPVNGCEHYASTQLCNQCRAAITLMFHNGHKTDGNNPIIPYFSVLK